MRYLALAGADVPGRAFSMVTRSAEEASAVPSCARIGDVIAGKFRVERVLGRGGMGIVVAASHVKLGQTVAIKFLLPSSLDELKVATRLLREARAAAALKGEHVARVFDVDVVDGAPYIVMEYLEGQTLASLLEAGGPLAATLAVDYALEACEALAEAHALGIVHRDLKPSNLFLARNPGGRQTLRVLDFGISKAFDGGAGETNPGGSRALGGARDVSTFSGTDSHALVGSPPYVSPEQLIRPREADARSDIWSLGVVLYQCLSGQLPFHGETLTRLWDSILREPMPAFDRVQPPISPELERIVRRCLEKDPGRRYADMRELARELAPLGSSRARASLEVIEGLALDGPRETPHASLVRGDTPALEQGETLTEAPTTRERTPDRTSPSANLPAFRSRARASALAIVALAVGLSFALRQEQRGDASSRPAAPFPRIPAPKSAPAQAISEPPVAVPATSLAPSGTPRPRPRPDASVVRNSAVRRKVDVSLAPSASAPAVREPVPVDVLARAEELLGKGRISDACAVGQIAAEAAEDSPRVLEFLGRCYMRLGAVDQARSYYRRYLEVAPSAPNAAFVRAMLEPKSR